MGLTLQAGVKTSVLGYEQKNSFFLICSGRVVQKSHFHVKSPIFMSQTPPVAIVLWRERNKRARRDFKDWETTTPQWSLFFFLFFIDFDLHMAKRDTDLERLFSSTAQIPQPYTNITMDEGVIVIEVTVEEETSDLDVPNINDNILKHNIKQKSSSSKRKSSEGGEGEGEEEGEDEDEEEEEVVLTDLNGLDGAAALAVAKKKRLCRYPGCNRVIKSQGHCQRHGAKAKRCKVEGCDKQAQGTHDGKP